MTYAAGLTWSVTWLHLFSTCTRSKGREGEAV